MKSYFDDYYYKRRKRRLKKLEKRETSSKMDAFYSPKNETPMIDDSKIKKRSHWEIMRKIIDRRQKRESDRYEIKERKEEYMRKRKIELKKKNRKNERKTS